jgi:hypothetical protein
MSKLFRNLRYNWGYFTEPVPTLRDRSSLLASWQGARRQ